MKEPAAAYYASLTDGYSTKIRQLVPHYDAMLDAIEALVRASAATSVLDLGAGVGEFASRLLTAEPSLRVTGVDLCDGAVAEAKRRLGFAGGRVTMVCCDIVQYEPGARFDVVVSNLVIHNLRPSQKRRLLERIATWLVPGGLFVWGDLMRHADPAVQSRLVEERIAFAADAGCPSDLIDENFRKEGQSDHPLTIEETARMAMSAGFGAVRRVWAHDMFAVFALTT
jgi:tRNA (cmo5U34)-methyltransferase